MIKFFRLYNSEKQTDTKNEEMLWLFETIEKRIQATGAAKACGAAFMFQVYYDFGYEYFTEKEGVLILETLNGDTKVQLD